MTTLINANPTIYDKKEEIEIYDEDDNIIDDITPQEIYNLIRNINDPEHPLTLQELNIVTPHQISITKNDILVRFTPTIPHCSMASLIGLSIRVQLQRTLAQRFKLSIKVKEKSHDSEEQVNKQLNDKERVAAALENQHLLKVVEKCLSNSL